jgi:UMF1 family MFS transporter
VFNLSREERSWIFYDVANSAFSLVIITTIMPVFFKTFAFSGGTDADATAKWGFANALASLVIAILAPVLGTMADQPGMKKRLFAVFLILGLLATVMLTVIAQGQWLLALTLFVISVIGFSGANIFYDAFLVDVSPNKRMDWVSSFGFACGYIGSVIPMVVILVIFYVLGSSNSTAAAKWAFIITALWWAVFSIPLLLHVKQKYHSAEFGRSIIGSFRQLGATFHSLRRHRNAVIFLGAYFLYIDGIGTIVKMAVPYGHDLGMSATNLVLIVLAIQVVACPCSLLYGYLSAKFSTRKLLAVGIAVYTVITFVGSTIPLLASKEHRLIMFWLLAMLIASSQGGVQSLSRSYFGKLIPKANSAEFFGFYNVFGKFAAVAGPLLMAVIIQLTGQSSLGFLSIGLLFVAGLLILLKIDDTADNENPQNVTFTGNGSSRID